MPIICLGPICFPIWGLIPVVLLFLKKFWGKLSVFLGLAKPDAAGQPDAAEMEATLAGLDPAQQRVVAVKTADQLENLKSSSKLKDELLVVKFGAEWCKPCKAIQPFYERLSAAPGATFCTVDMDEADGALSGLASSLPTFIVYGNKATVARTVGGDEAALFAALQGAGLFGAAAAAQEESKEAFDFSGAPACKT